MGTPMEGHRPPSGMADPTAHLLPGTEVNGFRLVRHLDSGGYGSVWLVESILHPGRLYALKFSRYPPGAPRQADARAVQEVRLLLQVAHPNVVRVVAHGRWQDPETGLHYVVMDWVEGSTLLVWTREHNPSLRTLVHLTQKMVRALQAAHEAGVVHRDMKPDNVLVRAADGEPFLADFGSGAAEGSHPLTQEGLPPGTPDFRSPEALAFAQHPGGAPYGFKPADDWYAVGVMLYLLLTEVLPFPKMLGQVSLEQWAASGRPAPPHLLNPRVPVELSRVVMWLLAKQPARRPRDGHALCEALDKALTVEGNWEASLYAPLEQRPPEAALTQAPTPGDGPPAEDPETRIKHMIRLEQGEEVARRELAARRRDELLSAQRRVGRPVARRAVAATTGGVLVIAGAVAWAWLSASPASTDLNPAASLAPAGPPGTPHIALPSSTVSLAPAAEDAFFLPPLLAFTVASPMKEDSTVKKTPQTTQTGVSATPAGGLAKTLRKTLCAAGAAATAAGCPGVPVRPDPKECPQVSIDNMRRLGIPQGNEVAAWIDGELGGHEPGSYRVGPMVGEVRRSDRPSVLPVGALLFGRVLLSGGDRFFVRYTELQVPGSPRVPICAIVRTNEAGVEKQPGSTADTYLSDTNDAVVKFVYKFAE
jgi:serine/threonine protein kinase